MNFDEKNIAKFDAFLHGEMTEDEKVTFNARLKNEANFNKEFDAFKRFEKSIENAELHAFQQKLKSWDQTNDSSSRSKVIPMRILTAVAALAVIGFISVTYFWSPSTNENIVAEYFEPYDNILTIRGEQTDIDNGLVFYDNKAYAAAIEQFEKYPENINAQFYMAESHLALKNYIKAAELYNQLLIDNSIFNEVVQLHLALAYIGLEENKKAINTLETISGDYLDEAQALLEDLK